MSMLIKGGRVIDPASDFDKICDVLIKDGVIAKIGENLQADGAMVIDATGKIVAPGLLDMHCHLREPGYEYKEDICSGTKAAAKGGFTSVACMPNTDPVIDTAALVDFIYKKAADTGCVHVYPIGAVTKGLAGEQLAEMGDMKSAGAVAVSDDGKPVSSPEIMRRALEYANIFCLPVISHCEDLSLVHGGCMNEGAVSTGMGLKGIPKAAEEVQIARDIILAKETGTKLHIAHVSTAGGVEMIRRAKQDGVCVTAETCPHYFTLTDEATLGFNTNAKMNPPLRGTEDVAAIIEGLRDGTIDAIATDHAPHHIDEKNVEFAVANNGIVGFETALGLGITYLVKTGKIALTEFIKKMTCNPAGILGLNKGELKEGKTADVLVFDIEKSYTVSVADFASKSKNSPYDGFVLQGSVEYTIVDGELVVSEGKLVK